MAQWRDCMVGKSNTMHYKRNHKKGNGVPQPDCSHAALIYDYLQMIKEDLDTGDLPFEKGEAFLTVDKKDMARLLHEYECIKNHALKSDCSYYRFGLKIKKRDEYIQIDYMLYTKNQGEKRLNLVKTSDYMITPLELELLLYLKSHRRSNYFSKEGTEDPTSLAIWFSDKGDCKEQFLYHEFCTAGELATLFDKFEYYKYSTRQEKVFTR